MNNNVKNNMQILHNTLSKYKPTKIYSLDVIISVGYRVKSQRGTMFRIWANKVLKELFCFVVIQSIAIWWLSNSRLTAALRLLSSGLMSNSSRWRPLSSTHRWE